jgi:N-acetylglutamate synthase-like GNAT family acetyltransferase
VLPGYQGRGIGKAILTRLPKKCAEHDITMVSLFAAQGKGGYYKPFGFEKWRSSSTSRDIEVPSYMQCSSTSTPSFEMVTIE